MKNNFTKFRKLLCYLIISIFILGIGGEVVKAESATFGSRGTLHYRYWGSLDNQSDYLRYSTYFQQLYGTINGQQKDAFCLDTYSAPPTGISLELNNSILNANQRKIVMGVLAKADSDSEVTKLSAGEKYYITQAAIWYKLYGVHPNGTNGITQGFYNWVRSSKYSSAWNVLIKAPTYDENKIYSLDVKGSSKLIESGDYLVSENFKINGKNVSGNFNVKVNDTSNGACILYSANGTEKCEANVNLNNNATFKVRVNNPGDSAGTVSTSVTVVPNTQPTVYDIKTYLGVNVNGSQIQSVAVVTDKTKTLSKTIKVQGNYTNDIDIQIQKLDSTTNQRVAGAILEVRDSSDNVLGTFTSVSEGTNPIIKLPEGDYKLVEISTPVDYDQYEREISKGYYLNENSQEFSVVNNGSELKVKQGDTILDTATISMSNDRIKIRFRKVDENGQPMAGIKFEIVSYAYAMTGGTNPKLCAYTDENGYLTRPCTGSDNTNNVKSDGIYTLGIDFGVSNDVFTVEEFCELDSCKRYDSGFNGLPMFEINDDSISSLNPFISVNNPGDGSVIELTMTNKYYIDISKTDITGGAEIPGASIIVTDPALNDDNVIDQWVSTSVPHRITGIEANHKYRLEETVAPEGFIKMVNAIDFIMDENGNVTTYDIDTGEAITDLVGSGYGLLITNAPVKTYFSKTSATTGEEIAGASLKVCTEESYNAAKASTGDGNNCETFVNPYTNKKVEWVSEAGKTHIEDALPSGNYYLIEEMAPEGYVKQVNSASFTVKNDGTITKVEMKNETTKVFISKKDVTTGDEIPGAELKICTLDDYEKDGANCNPAREDTKWISGTEEHKIETLPFGDYVLIETLPASNYEEGMIIDGELMTAYKFTISQDNNNIKIDVYNQLMNVPNTGISTLNLFAIGGLLVFVGYETIKIYRKRALIK